jgi:hypothetical protein
MAIADKPKGPRKSRAADAAPKAKSKSGAHKRTERKAAEIRLIREGFAELLCLPGFPAAIKGDQWAVDHFAIQGPRLANRIAKEAERNDAFRKQAVKLLAAQGAIMLGLDAFMYAVPALMHYGVLPGADRMGVPVLTKGKPPPEPPRRPQPDPAPAAAPAPSTEPQPSPSVDVADEVVPGYGEVPPDPLAEELATGNGQVPAPPIEAV